MAIRRAAQMRECRAADHHAAEQHEFGSGSRTSANALPSARASKGRVRARGLPAVAPAGRDNSQG